MNVQQLPRKDKVVKRAFVPKLDYMLFADYDQIEMRVLAYYLARLGDDSMKDVLADPTRDLHRESAKGIFQIDREPTDAERQLGKNMNFSMVYMAGRPAVLKYLAEFVAQGGKAPVTWKYAKQVLDRFHATWPGIRQLLVPALEQQYATRGYLMTVHGARLHPQPTKNSVKPAVLSSVVQSSAAEVMRRAMRECSKQMADMDSHLVCVVHDELVFDCTKAEFPTMVEKVPEWMVYPTINDVVPTTVSMEWSDTNWAEKKGLDE